MKFKNKETGAIFDYNNYLFCGQYDGYCPNCPIFSRLEGLATGRVSDCCDKWVSSHLKEAAELMGFEVIDEGDALEPTHHQKVTRKSILQKAEKCVCSDREGEYSGPENNFKTIASLWTCFLYSKGLIVSEFSEWKCIEPEDVAIMMALLKIARISTGVFKEDSYVDACGYLACGGELEGREASEN